jgi:putative ABC transport system ATP-binding protein
MKDGGVTGSIGGSCAAGVDATGPTPVVELLDARRVYGVGRSRVVGLAGVDFTVWAREFVAVIGTSGSGKSTLLHVVGTLDRLDSGRYRIDGDDVGQLDDPALSALRCRKIGFVFQAFNLLPRCTALENVELPMVYAGVKRAERRRRALTALERVGLSERYSHLPSQLSGGQQQRVSVARALVNQPSLLLADEPTGALDSATTGEVLALFASLHESGVTILLVTHDREVAARTNRVVRMRDGQIEDDSGAVRPEAA